MEKTKTTLVSEQEVLATLDAALKRKDPRAFMNALKPIVKEHGGFAAIARETTLNRTALYRLVSSANDAKLGTLLALLPSLGLRLSVKRFRNSKHSSQKRGKITKSVGRTEQSR